MLTAILVSLCLQPRYYPEPARERPMTLLPGPSRPRPTIFRPASDPMTDDPWPEIDPGSDPDPVLPRPVPSPPKPVPVPVNPKPMAVPPPPPAKVQPPAFERTWYRMRDHPGWEMHGRNAYGLIIDVDEFRQVPVPVPPSAPAMVPTLNIYGGVAGYGAGSSSCPGGVCPPQAGFFFRRGR